MPALAALVTRCYMTRHGLDADAMTRVLGAVAIKNHAAGVKNPYAQFRKAITEDDYLGSKPVATPLRLYDCAPITDGAVGLVLTSEMPRGAKSRGVRVIGLGHATDTIALRHRSSFTGFKSTRLAASQAYAMAGIKPKDVSFAEIHDAFTPFEVIGTEDLGFFGDGLGGRAVLDGVTAPTGRLPVNPSGGLKARGHPVGASGLAQVVEAVWQLRGDAGPERQLPSPAVGLVQSIGGLANNNLVAILDRADRGRVHAVAAVPPKLDELPVKRGEPEALEGARLDSYTVLHVRADGQKEPLFLGLVRTRDGHRVLARADSDAHLAVGAPVALVRDGFHYTFTVTPQSAVERLAEGIENVVHAVSRPVEQVVGAVRRPDRLRWFRRWRRRPGTGTTGD
jgi:acetyl-CoA C-acetyltransferase